MLLDRIVQPEERQLSLPREVRRESSLVTAAERGRLSGVACGVTFWLTGLSGAGKTTIGRLLEQRLIESGQLAILLDGDNLRHGLNRDLSFTAADRLENIRRTAEVAALFNAAGLHVIAALISPTAADRRQAREVVGAERFLEIFIDTPLEVCEERDVKGLYRRARTGEIPSFTGVSAPYEEPQQPALRLDTVTLDAESAAAAIMKLLESVTD